MNKNKLDQICFVNDPAFADSKVVVKRTVSGKVL